MLVSDLVLDIFGELAFLPQFQLRPLGFQVLPVPIVGYVWAVSDFRRPVTITVLILSAFFLPVNGLDMNAEALCDLFRLLSVFELLLHTQSIGFC